MSRLKNKVAVVTGAGGGIGRAISRLFASQGAKLVCIDINEDTLDDTVKQVEQAGGQAEAIAADVADETTSKKAAMSARSKFGGLDVLVANAVYDLPLGPLTDISYQDWRRTIDVNLNSAFLLSKHFIPLMDERGGGSIVFVASQLAEVARPGRPWYCAAKGGLVNLARAMAVDHAHQKIRVNSLSPGPVETDRYLKNFNTLEDARASNHTLFNRLGTPEEIANGALFLASDESGFMTGSDLLIDGGYRAV